MTGQHEPLRNQRWNQVLRMRHLSWYPHVVSWNKYQCRQLYVHVTEYSIGHLSNHRDILLLAHLARRSKWAMAWRSVRPSFKKYMYMLWALFNNKCATITWL